jgi:Ni,Fe-hydrogenase III large subunit
VEALREALREGRPVAVWFEEGRLRFLVERGGKVEAFAYPVRERFPSLSPDVPALEWFERDLWERHGLVPEGHPALKPLRDHRRPYPFDEVEGLHQVPVGPVHAGIIEPGHFRFHVLGERIFHLEIRLGYQHRGVLPLFEGKRWDQALLLAERVGGEPVAHALAFARAAEAALGWEVPPRGQALRRVYLELERVFQHLGHLTGLFTDIGYAYAATQVGRVRALLQGEVERFTGHRYGRGAVRLGGVWRDVPGETLGASLSRIAALRRELQSLLPGLLKDPMVLDRMRYVGVVSQAQALLLGMVGPAARASGVPRDLRQDEPFYAPFPLVVEEGGDVLARARVYAREALVSLELVEKELAQLPSGAVWAEGPLGEGEAWARVEAARGELFYWVRFQSGRVARVEAVDPSFKNWRGLALAVRGMGLPDFPLCNKSFDLSYAGCDL